MLRINLSLRVDRYVFKSQIIFAIVEAIGAMIPIENSGAHKKVSIRKFQ